MQPPVEQALTQLLAHQNVSAENMESALGEIMDGRCQPTEIAAFLTALAMKGETADELAGAARAMRARAARISSLRTGLVDTCGTGGDKLHTFNISTATAILVSATGIPIAKHGNKGVSSSSGSADVLEQLGVRIDLSPEEAGRCLDEIGLCFCYARVCHSAMRHVAAVRSELKFRTLFNLLGPLTNPAGASFQLLGAGRNKIAHLLALTLSKLGTQRAFVVCGNDELDEVSLWGTTVAYEVTPDSVRQQTWTAASFHLPECSVNELKVASAAESADRIQSIFQGAAGPNRDIVLANAAAALVCAGQVSELRAGVEAAARAIDSGAAREQLQRLKEFTHRSRS